MLRHLFWKYFSYELKCSGVICSGHLCCCLAAECLGLESLQPFSLNHRLITREAVMSTLRFCSLKKPLKGQPRFGSLLITYFYWAEPSNYLLASHYRLIFPIFKLGQSRKMEKNYAETLSSFTQTPWLGKEGYSDDKINGLPLLWAFFPHFVFTT